MGKVSQVCVRGRERERARESKGVTERGRGISVDVVVQLLSLV